MQTNRAKTEDLVVTPETLALKDYDTLIDLMQHKVNLLMAATISQLPDKEYIQNLNSEVEAIQAEIKRRLDSSPDPVV